MTGVDDLIERLSTEGRDALLWEDEPVLLAALRLAEAEVVCRAGQLNPDACIELLRLLANYRSARQRLTGIAP